MASFVQQASAQPFTTLPPKLRDGQKKKLQKGDDLTFFATEMARVHANWKDAPLPE